MRLPKLYRKKRADGRFTGSYRAKIDGEEVNLGTSDAKVAQKRLLSAVKKGAREFSDELDEAVEAMEAAPPDPPPDPPPAAPAAAAVAPAAPAAAAATATNATTSDTPAATTAASPSVDAAAEAAATAAAAAETAAAAAAPPANDNAAETKMDPDVLRSLVEQGAHVVVEGQLWLQAWMIKRQTGEAPPQMPIEVRDAQGQLVLNPMTGKPLESPRAIAAKCWVAQFEKWFPNLDLPEWAIALFLTAMYIPAQYAAAATLAAEKKKAGGTESQKAAA